MSDDWKHKASGRSFLMAIIFIEKAIKQPGVWINIWDHGPHHPKKEHFMLDMIKKIVDDHYPELMIKIHISNHSFSLERK